MKNALRIALHLRVQEAEKEVAAARARMDELLHGLRQEGEHPQDLQRAHELDEAVRNVEEAEAFARGVKATCDFLAAEVLGDRRPEDPNTQAKSV